MRAVHTRTVVAGGRKRCAPGVFKQFTPPDSMPCRHDLTQHCTPILQVMRTYLVAEVLAARGDREHVECRAGAAQQQQRQMTIEVA
jgi:hypothetical protein